MKALKIVIAALLSVSFCFVCIGYANLTDTLTVLSDASISVQKNVYISEANVDNAAGVTVNGYLATTLNSTVTLGASGSSSVSFDIHLYNNSPYVYVFETTEYIEEAYDNPNIVFSLSGLVPGQSIVSYSYLTFNITFSYKNSTPAASRILNSVLNFKFVLDSEYIPEAAVDGAVEKFEEILNTKSDFDTLITHMENEAANNNRNETYVGNVVGAGDGDTKFLNGLFSDEDGDSKLTLEIKGEKTNVTAMIKRENLDGNTATGDDSGNEMTIYLTADDLSGRNWWSPGEVTVYAVVYTKTADGKWVQLSEMLEGKATANNYAGSWFGEVNSFNTDTWESTAVHYGVAAGASIETIVAAIKE